MEETFRHNSVPPALDTRRLALRALTLEDVDDLFAFASDPAVAAYLDWPVHATRADSLHQLKRTHLRYATGHYEWGIVERSAGRLIGTCGFVAWTPKHRRAEITYVVAREWWSKGVATEAAAAVIGFGFEELGLNRIEAHCLPEHAASQRVMAKLGMQFEGILREHVLLKGRFVDLAVYAVLRGDWVVAMHAPG